MQANNAIPTEMRMVVSVMVNVNDCRKLMSFLCSICTVIVERNMPTEFRAHDHLPIKMVFKLIKSIHETSSC